MLSLFLLLIPDLVARGELPEAISGSEDWSFACGSRFYAAMQPLFLPDEPRSESGNDS